jgi:thiamine monophosphate synthase
MWRLSNAPSEGVKCKQNMCQYNDEMVCHGAAIKIQEICTNASAVCIIFDHSKL